MMQHLTLLVLLIASTVAEYSHNQFRNYTCVRQQAQISSMCRLRFDGATEEWDALNDNGCFMEFDPRRKEALEFCPLQCADAKTAYMEAKTPLKESKCLAYFNYNVIRRRTDWFLWRAGECLNEEIQFRIGCTFPYKPRHLDEKKKIF